MAQKPLPTEPSKAKFAQPIAAKGEPEKMPPLTEELSPEEYKRGVIRKGRVIEEIGDVRIWQSRGGYTWAGGGTPAEREAALKRFEMARKRRARARKGLNPKTGEPIKATNPDAAKALSATPPAPSAKG